MATLESAMMWIEESLEIPVKMEVSYTDGGWYARLVQDHQYTVEDEEGPLEARDAVMQLAIDELERKTIAFAAMIPSDL